MTKKKTTGSTTMGSETSNNRPSISTDNVHKLTRAAKAAIRMATSSTVFKSTDFWIIDDEKI
jgi:hypothetical protein